MGLLETLFANKKESNQGTASLVDKRGLKPILGKGGFIIGKNLRMDLKKSFEHLALVGPTGSGKSATFFIPNLLDLYSGTSAVVTDPKGELYRKTGPWLEENGFVPVQIAPFERPNPGYNPLFVASSYAEIKEVAQLILMNGSLSFEQAGKGGGDSTWLNMAMPLLAATFLYEKSKSPENPRIGRALDRVLELSMDEMEKHFMNDKYAYREYLIFKSAAGSEKTISSIKVTLATNMQLFLDDTIREFVESPDIHPAHVRQYEKPIVLFVSVPETKSLYAAPLMATIYQQLLQRLQDLDGRPVLFFLDEFSNIGVIPVIDVVAATARSRSMGLAIGLQGIEQLRQNYGDAKANNLLNNLKTKIFLPGLSMESCKFASEMCGYTTVEMKSNSESGKIWSLFNDSKSESVSQQRREVLTPDEIRRMDSDKALIIADNLQPSLVNKVFYFKEPRYTSRSTEPTIR